MRKVFAALILSVLLFMPLKAQEAFVVQTCGVLPQNYAVGSTRFPTIDTTGKACGYTGLAGYPTGATATVGNAIGSTASLTATLSAVLNKTNYLCGFTYQGSNPTAAANVVIAVTGIGNLTGGFGYPTGAIATPAIPQPPPLTVTFSPCLPANGSNVAIVVQSSALGAGAPIASIAAWGFVL